MPAPVLSLPVLSTSMRSSHSYCVVRGVLAVEPTEGIRRRRPTTKRCGMSRRGWWFRRLMVQKFCVTGVHRRLERKRLRSGTIDNRTTRRITNTKPFLQDASLEILDATGSRFDHAPLSPLVFGPIFFSEYQLCFGASAPPSPSAAYTVFAGHHMTRSSKFVRHGWLREVLHQCPVFAHRRQRYVARSSCSACSSMRQLYRRGAARS